MHDYELVYILQADLDDTVLNGIAENIEALINNSHGEIVKEDRWGRRKLAYPIRKFKEGYYVCVTFKVDPQEVVNIRRALGYNENVLRYIVVKKA